jgi:hypothetical protein
MRQDLANLDRDIRQPLGRVIQEAFKHGIDCDIIQGGLIPGRSVQSSYEASVIQNYLLGSRRTSWDGRVYRYAKATNIISSTNFGLKFWAELGDGIGYTAPLQIQKVGDTTIKVDSGKGTAGVAEDELIGGYVIIHTHGESYDQFRGIFGNTVADASGYVTITLDAPLTIDVAVTFGVEVYPNPYASVRVRQASHGGGGDRYSSVAGMADVKTTIADYYIWIQTWGPRWINPQGDIASVVTVDRRGLVFDYEGSITQVDVNTATTAKMQYAGFVINRESVANGTGPPLVMLQISP